MLNGETNTYHRPLKSTTVHLFPNAYIEMYKYTLHYLNLSLYHNNSHTHATYFCPSFLYVAYLLSPSLCASVFSLSLSLSPTLFQFVRVAYFFSLCIQSLSLSFDNSVSVSLSLSLSFDYSVSVSLFLDHASVNFDRLCIHFSFICWCYKL